MSSPAPKSVRRRFLVALGRSLYVTWPVLSATRDGGRPRPPDRFRRGVVGGREAVYFSFGRGRRSRTSKSACPMGRLCREVP